MGRVSQRHRQETVGLDSSGRPPQPGSTVIPQAQAIAIVKAAGNEYDPAIITLVGDTFVGTEVFDVKVTPATGGQIAVTPSATAGNALQNAQVIATALDGDSKLSAVAFGSRIEVIPSNIDDDPIVVDEATIV